jgi:hypothetical protein
MELGIPRWEYEWMEYCARMGSLRRLMGLGTIGGLDTAHPQPWGKWFLSVTGMIRHKKENEWA